MIADVMAFIEFNAGPREGETVELNKAKIMFGRQLSCDGIIVHPTISREHFSIEQTGGKFFLVDQKSGNGTLVNGERVSWV
ncbi:MAG TPA: FHA domain-containing protein, partial [Blastocatellia bacterium]